MSDAITLRLGDQSPWGAIDLIEQLGRGVFCVSTASHGGIYLAPDRRAHMPASLVALDAPGGRGRARAAGWYEEDCDWARVALAFPDLFPTAARQSAIKIAAAAVFPFAYAAWRVEA